MTHIAIIIAIITSIGALAGLTNYLNFYFKGLIKNKYEIFKHLVSGIGASILVPLLLNMLSSDLIKEVEPYDPINYFVFAGFCFIAGYFSDRFINSIGDKVLKDLEMTNKKVDKAISSVKETEEKLDFIVSTDSEIDDLGTETNINLNDFSIQGTFTDDDLQTQTDKIIKAFKGEYRFRTAIGIAKELNYNTIVVKRILEEFKNNGILKKLTSKNENKVLWGLTKMGSQMGMTKEN